MRLEDYNAYPSIQFLFQIIDDQKLDKRIRGNRKRGGLKSAILKFMQSYNHTLRSILLMECDVPTKRYLLQVTKFDRMQFAGENFGLCEDHANYLKNYVYARWREAMNDILETRQF